MIGRAALLGSALTRDITMKRFLALCLAAWSAAALLYFGRHSTALIVLSGVLALAGFDIVKPDAERRS
ncbi:hypothetical protein YK56LOC_49110 [Caballeronia sp. HLA56]